MVNRFTCLVFVASFLQLSSFASAQRDLKVIPPADPELERKTFVLPEGFEVNLFAADPQIAKPIQMNFDEQGRLWIASSETYPQVEPGESANDKILFLQDVDGDGVSDKTQIFTDGLLIPTAVAPGDGGVYVGASTELLHFKDTDGDGKADQKKIIFSGFGTEDTHHIIHTLRYGPDVHLYFNQSIYIHSHIETPWGVRRLNAGGMWRFRPETLELSVFARGLVNQWGTDFDRYGQTFATDGAGGEGINYIVPGAYYTTAYGAKRILRGLNPGSPKHCGLEIVETPHLPDDWQGSLITNDFRGHRVCRFVLTEDGSGYRSQEQQEVIKSDHVAFRPVDVKQGPDGAIYIADWYNPIIQHGEVDFRDERRDHTHGRIWRVSYKGNQADKPRDLTQLDNTSLLQLLETSNRYDRDKAKQVLKERGTAVLADVEKWLDGHRGEPEYEQLALEALWMHQAFGQVDSAIIGTCLTSQDHRIRAAATRTIGQLVQKIDAPQELLKERIADDHPLVRLEAVRALAEVKQPEAIVVTLQALNFEMDEFIDYALWLTCRELESVWTPALLADTIDLSTPPQALPFLLRATGSSAGTSKLVSQVTSGGLSGAALDNALQVIADLGNREQLGTLLQLVVNDDSEITLKTKLMNALGNAGANRKLVPQGDISRVAPLLTSESEALRISVLRAIGAWKSQGLRSHLLGTIQSQSATTREKITAVEALGAFNDQQAAQQIQQLGTKSSDLALRREAIEELLRFRPQLGAKLAVDFLHSASAKDAEPLWGMIVSRKGAGDLLAMSLGDAALPKDVAILGVRILSSSGQQDSVLLKQLQASGKLNQEPVKLTAKEMADMVAAMRQQGRPAHGEQVFRREALNCYKCHAIGPAGGVVGSNLISLGATAQPDYIIESLLDPNAKVKEGYHTLVVVTDEGKIFLRH